MTTSILLETEPKPLLKQVCRNNIWQEKRAHINNLLRTTETTKPHRRNRGGAFCFGDPRQVYRVLSVHSGLEMQKITTLFYQSIHNNLLRLGINHGYVVEFLHYF